MPASKTQQRSLFVSHLNLLKHGQLDHPENKLRLEAILSLLQNHPDLELTFERHADFSELAEAHDSDYVRKIMELSGKSGNLDHETRLTEKSVEAATLAAGLGLELVERVLSNRVSNGFALVRPPGHHATRSQAMGFCVFNNIAVAAKRALQLGIKRILILDWDVHHGNGTQDIFYEEDRVFFVDFHQDDLFPKNSGHLSEKGSGRGAGYTLNIPLPHSCRDEDYSHIFDQLIVPLATQYQPELILVSAGFDAHETDPLASMSLTTNGFALLTQRTKALADQLCDGKLILFLEGGYDPLRLSQNVKACTEILREVASTLSPEDGLKVYSNDQIIALVATIASANQIESNLG